MLKHGSSRGPYDALNTLPLLSSYLNTDPDRGEANQQQPLVEMEALATQMANQMRTNATNQRARNSRAAPKMSNARSSMQGTQALQVKCCCCEGPHRAFECPLEHKPECDHPLCRLRQRVFHLKKYCPFYSPESILNEQLRARCMHENSLWAAAQVNSEAPNDEDAPPAAQPEKLAEQPAADGNDGNVPEAGANSQDAPPIKYGYSPLEITLSQPPSLLALNISRATLHRLPQDDRTQKRFRKIIIENILDAVLLVPAFEEESNTARAYAALMRTALPFHDMAEQIDHNLLTMCPLRSIAEVIHDTCVDLEKKSKEKISNKEKPFYLIPEELKAIHQKLGVADQLSKSICDYFDPNSSRLKDKHVHGKCTPHAAECADVRDNAADCADACALDAANCADACALPTADHPTARDNAAECADACALHTADCADARSNTTNCTDACALPAGAADRADTNDNHLDMKSDELYEPYSNHLDLGSDKLYDTRGYALNLGSDELYKPYSIHPAVGINQKPALKTFEDPEAHEYICKCSNLQAPLACNSLEKQNLGIHATPAYMMQMADDGPPCGRFTSVSRTPTTSPPIIGSPPTSPQFSGSPSAPLPCTGSPPHSSSSPPSPRRMASSPPSLQRAESPSPIVVPPRRVSSLHRRVSPSLPSQRHVVSSPLSTSSLFREPEPEPSPNSSPKVSVTNKNLAAVGLVAANLTTADLITADLAVAHRRASDLAIDDPETYHTPADKIAAVDVTAVDTVDSDLGAADLTTVTADLMTTADSLPLAMYKYMGSPPPSLHADHSQLPSICSVTLPPSLLHANSSCSPDLHLNEYDPISAQDTDVVDTLSGPPNQTVLNIIRDCDPHDTVDINCDPTNTIDNFEPYDAIVDTPHSSEYQDKVDVQIRLNEKFVELHVLICGDVERLQENLVRLDVLESEHLEEILTCEDSNCSHHQCGGVGLVSALPCDGSSEMSPLMASHFTPIDTAPCNSTLDGDSPSSVLLHTSYDSASSPSGHEEQSLVVDGYTNNAPQNGVNLNSNKSGPPREMGGELPRRTRYNRRRRERRRLNSINQYDHVEILYQEQSQK